MDSDTKRPTIVEPGTKAFGEWLEWLKEIKIIAEEEGPKEWREISLDEKKGTLKLVRAPRHLPTLEYNQKWMTIINEIKANISFAHVKCLAVETNNKEFGHLFQINMGWTREFQKQIKAQARKQATAEKEEAIATVLQGLKTLV